MTKRVVAIVQARMGSTRLPGKVLQDIAGEPMLARVVERTRRARLLDDVVVATTDLVQDDPLAHLARQRGWLLTRGSETDVLDRYVRAARNHGAAIIVRITSDCPLLSPMLVDQVILSLQSTGADYASNTLEPRTYPRGLDVEAFTAEALETAWREDRTASSREHVTPFIYRNPARFALHRVAHDLDLSSHRWTVDTPEDLELVRRVFGQFGNRPFEWEEVLGLIGANPDWALLNAHVAQKRVP